MWLKSTENTISNREMYSKLYTIHSLETHILNQIKIMLQRLNEICVKK
jgi:hypothetical protein